MTDLSGRTIWRYVLGMLMAVGALLSLLSLGIGNAALTAAGDLMAAIGFLTWAIAELTGREWARAATSAHLPRWAAIVLVIGGLGFAAGLIANGYIVLVR